MKRSSRSKRHIGSGLDSIRVRSSVPIRSSSAVLACSWASALVRAVMSREMPKVPMIFPSKSRSGCLLQLKTRSEASGSASTSRMSNIGTPVWMISCSFSNAVSACVWVK